jgi:hypothetical protein
MNSPATARDAAVNILLKDFSDLLTRLEKCQREHGELQETQKLITQDFDGDMNKLGEHVAQINTAARKAEEAGRAAAAAGQRLENAAGRIEAGAGVGQRLSAAAPSQQQGKGAAVIFAVLLALALVWAVGATWKIFTDRDVVAVGRATLKAWPALDTPARKTIEATSAASR